MRIQESVNGSNILTRSVHNAYLRWNSAYSLEDCQSALTAER